LAAQAPGRRRLCGIDGRLEFEPEERRLRAVWFAAAAAGILVDPPGLEIIPVELHSAMVAARHKVVRPPVTVEAHRLQCLAWSPLAVALHVGNLVAAREMIAWAIAVAEKATLPPGKERADLVVSLLHPGYVAPGTAGATCGLRVIDPIAAACCAPAECRREVVDFALDDLCAEAWCGRVDPCLPDQHGVTSLHAAAESGDAYVVRRLLVDCCADPEATDKNGVTPVMLAAMSGDVESFRLILYSAVLNRRRKFASDTAVSGPLVPGGGIVQRIDCAEIDSPYPVPTAPEVTAVLAAGTLPEVWSVTTAAARSRQGYEILALLHELAPLTIDSHHGVTEDPMSHGGAEVLEAVVAAATGATASVDLDMRVHAAVQRYHDQVRNMTGVRSVADRDNVTLAHAACAAGNARALELLGHAADGARHGTACLGSQSPHAPGQCSHNPNWLKWRGLEIMLATCEVPAFFAAEAGEAQLLSILPGLSHANRGGVTPAYIAAQRGATECIKVLRVQ
jgi:ankyrin repeat protein